jgi:hypothetical protein
MRDDIKTCLIRQPAGLGDVFFLQKAASHLIANGYRIIWPIADHYDWVVDYIKRDGIEYIKESDDFPYKQYYHHELPILSEKFTFLPFQSADRILNTSPMKAKYPLAYMSPVGWQDHFSFRRNEKRERKLREFLEIKEGEEFIFVNDMLGSPPDIFHRPMNIQTDLRVIKNNMSMFEKFNVFDYCWVLENAKEIHTVETCFCYLIEKLNTTDELFMYSRMVNGRNQNTDFSYIDFVYKKKWKTILKREINEITGSDLVEEKSYQEYSKDA